MRKLTHSEVRELMDYDAETGIFTWKVAVSNLKPGTRVGTISPKTGAVGVIVRNERWYAHRLAFLWMGVPVPKIVDHIDGNPTNNAWANLRPATPQQNGANSKRSKNNTSGYKGVYWQKQIERWCAEIWVNRKKHFLGTFDTPEAAHAAYVEAAKKFNGEFARAA